MSDDEIIGLKSTAIRFKENIKLFVSVNYFITLSLIIYLFKTLIGFNFFTFFLIVFASSIIYQIINFKKNEKKNYLKLFKLNNFTGLTLFLGILSINF